MKALIFSAGRGERMRPLSDTMPKPLLRAGGKRLLEWHLEALARADVREVVINTSHLASQFPETLGDGSRYGVRIEYSYEGDTALETGGGMLHAVAYGLVFDSLGRALAATLAERAELDAADIETRVRVLLAEPARERIERVARLALEAARDGTQRARG